MSRRTSLGPARLALLAVLLIVLLNFFISAALVGRVGRGGEIDGIDQPAQGRSTILPYETNTSCPRAYFYFRDMVEKENLHDPHRTYGAVFANSGNFGDPTAYKYDSQQHDFVSSVFNRYLWPKGDAPARCQVVTNPLEADIFFVPILGSPIRESKPWESATIWKMMPPNYAENQFEKCKILAHRGDEFLNRLPYLSEATASKHVLLPSSTFSDAYATCDEINEMFYFVKRRNRRLLSLFQRMVRISTNRFDGAAVLTPLVSSIHVNNSRMENGPLPWDVKCERRYLLSFVGSTKGTEESARLRTFIKARCEEYGPSTCGLLSKDIGFLVPSALELKENSTFCLEPPGFGAHRKSTIDSLLSGCIPVLFTSSFQFWPTHWQSFVGDSRIIIEAEDVLSRKVDILETLRSIPPERIAKMRRTILNKARHLMYALDDVADDALEITLREVVKFSKLAPSGTFIDECKDAQSEDLGGRFFLPKHVLPAPCPQLHDRCMEHVIDPRIGYGRDLMELTNSTIYDDLQVRDFCPKACGYCS